MNNQENLPSQIAQEANEGAFSLEEEQLEEVTGAGGCCSGPRVESPRPGPQFNRQNSAPPELYPRSPMILNPGEQTPTIIAIPSPLQRSLSSHSIGSIHYDEVLPR